MAIDRRARVAERLPGIDVLRLSAADLRSYAEWIQARDAEIALASPSASPEQVEAAALVVTGDPVAAQVAAAKAKLRQSALQKGF